MRASATAVLATVVALALTAGIGRDLPAHPVSPASTTQHGRWRPLDVVAGPISFRLGRESRRRLSATDVRRAVRHWIALHATRFDDHAGRLVLRWTGRARATFSRAVRSNTRRLRLSIPLQSAILKLPTLRQVYRNNCETAALSIALRGDVSQTTLQAQLPRAAPLEPNQGSRGRVWGDPEIGFVGDVRGGGYGVYDRPLLRLGRRYGKFQSLTGRPVSELISALWAGRPVVAWVLLGPSAPMQWTTPRGIIVQANWAEHTVVLYGWRPGRLLYIDPWDGTRGTYSIPVFSRLWASLGRRAIAAPPRR